MAVTSCSLIDQELIIYNILVQLLEEACIPMLVTLLTLSIFSIFYLFYVYFTITETLISIHNKQQVQQELSTKYTVMIPEALQRANKMAETWIVKIWHISLLKSLFF